MSPEKKSLIENKDVQMFNKNIPTISYYRENNANPNEDFERMSDNEENLSKDDSFYKRSGKFQIAKKKPVRNLSANKSSSKKKNLASGKAPHIESSDGKPEFNRVTTAATSKKQPISPSISQGILKSSKEKQTKPSTEVVR